MKNNKGFTLVEMAIVLIILGLLMTVVIKSYNLFFASLLTKELTRMNKLETAVQVYVEKFHELPAKAKDLTDEGIITPADLYSEYAGDSTYAYLDPNWRITRCSTSNVGDKIPNAFRDRNGNMVCTVLGAPFELVCYIEKKLDDDNVTTGNATAESTTDFNAGNASHYVHHSSSCSLQPLGNTYAIRYYYRLY